MFLWFICGTVTLNPAVKPSNQLFFLWIITSQKLGDPPAFQS